MEAAFEYGKAYQAMLDAKENARDLDPAPGHTQLEVWRDESVMYKQGVSYRRYYVQRAWDARLEAMPWLVRHRPKPPASNSVCPVCGGQVTLESKYWGEYFVGCQTCGMRTYWGSSDTWAWFAWDTWAKQIRKRIGNREETPEQPPAKEPAQEPAREPDPEDGSEVPTWVHEEQNELKSPAEYGYAETEFNTEAKRLFRFIDLTVHDELIRAGRLFHAPDCGSDFAAVVLKSMAIDWAESGDWLYTLEYGSQALDFCRLYPDKWLEVARMTSESRQRFLKGLGVADMNDYFRQYSPLVLSFDLKKTAWEVILESARRKPLYDWIASFLLPEGALYDSLPSWVTWEMFDKVCEADTALKELADEQDAAIAGMVPGAEYSAQP